MEVPPQTLVLSGEVVDQVAKWNALYQILDLLWLDSGASEGWAQGQPADLTSAVHTRGKALRLLNDTRRCYYWYFQDQSVENYVPQRTCPVCGETLLDYPTGIFLQRVCERDSLVVGGE